jgi:hypothetical protein
MAVRIKNVFECKRLFEKGWEERLCKGLWKELEKGYGKNWRKNWGKNCEKNWRILYIRI